jgi:hypothetical protein
VEKPSVGNTKIKISSWCAGQIGRGNRLARGCGMLLNSEFIIFLLNFDNSDEILLNFN